MSLRDTLISTLVGFDEKVADARSRKSHVEAKTWLAAGNEIRSALGLDPKDPEDDDVLPERPAEGPSGDVAPDGSTVTGDE